MHTPRPATKSAHEIYTDVLVQLLNKSRRGDSKPFGYVMGRVWAKVYRQTGTDSRSIVYFVKNTGAIHRAESWKKPGARMADTDQWDFNVAANGPHAALAQQGQG